MAGRVERAGLAVEATLARFVEEAALPGSGVGAAAFWRALAGLVAGFGPRNRALLARREELQQKIDAWHVSRRGRRHDPAAYRAHLEEIGYLVPEGPAFAIATPELDPEVGVLAGPQLVVPATNARYVLNAANARWGSLYDALYGTDAPGAPPEPGPYDPARGARVIAWARELLDVAAPLAGAGWADVTGLRVEGGALVALTGAGRTALADPRRFAGHATGRAGALARVYLVNHGLHVGLVIDRGRPVGASDPAGIADVQMEAALSAIVDLEDSVACVDGADKAAAYRTWLGLMTGTLTEEVTKGAETFTRRLAADLPVVRPDGWRGALRARSLLMVRNVGLLMTTPAVLGPDGAEIPEGLLDALVSVLCALHDLRRPGGPANSPRGHIYVVKPKLHGPEEAAFAAETFAAVEAALGLPPGTVKLGLMDEERRTSANLGECLRALKDRIAFVNTGFLDRTGDEIHTAMEAGPMARKGEMRATAWLRAYEDRNVDIALACGMGGRAQIGKGMWAKPDRMAEMLAEKGAQPAAGASTAWVPSPTAAVLHATHYHRVDVAAVQAAIAAGGPRAGLGALLTPPLAPGRNWSAEEIRRELDTNAQGILGYVVRWVDQGIGCSKVPDLDDVGLMEDRATCRISAQALANWLLHGVVGEGEVMEAMRRMAAVVDRQNAADPAYRPMAPGFDGHAFQAACDLVFLGRFQPSGYTEPVLHARRLQAKAAAAAAVSPGGPGPG
ncbi:MAG: malate synthase G [Rhodobacteraceae bacterium]|nr:malate synthase G [Paracoccaceae bacterium]